MPYHREVKFLSDKADNDQLKIFLANIYGRILRCKEDRITGELVISIPFSDGVMGKAKVSRSENLRVK